MSASDSSQLKSGDTQTTRHLTPGSPLGWWALGLSVLGLSAWVVLPVITMTFRETYPVTDTWVMPVIWLVLADVAAGFNVLCIWRWKERSALNIVAVALTIPAALFVTVMVVGEGLAGA
ncbi:MAG: hypothetical protein PF636_02580 [Actinomycetota bacterium]|jgi:predicted branched-subunit amino acid permease|nr:hypothetical protein [Actinomycetota bacterium]